MLRQLVYLFFVLVLSAVATRHTVPSVAYIVWERRKKLKVEYQGLSGDQIRDFRLTGVEPAHVVKDILA